MLSVILNKFWTPIEAFWRSQWKGLITGSLLALLGTLLCWWFFVRPDLDRYHDLGMSLGRFRVAKGEEICVARNELEIRFEGVVYNVTKRDSLRRPVDSVLLFPMIRIGGYNEVRESFYVGRRLGIDAEYFYYVIEMSNLQTEGTDTVAWFDVYRREYPANLNKKP